MIKAIAIDDEPLALAILQTFCQETDGIDLLRTFTKPQEAEEYLKTEKVDLVFLDIQMPSISGLEFFKKIPEGIQVVFTTAFAEFAVDGFNLQALDYLLKPFSYERFKQSIDKVSNYLELLDKPDNNQEQILQIRADYSLYRIKTSDILYIEGLDDYVKIVLKDHKPIVARITMKNMVEKLPFKDFIRIHRSFIVPLGGIISYRNKMVHLAQKEFPVGSSYLQEVEQRLRNSE